MRLRQDLGLRPNPPGLSALDLTRGRGPLGPIFAISKRGDALSQEKTARRTTAEIAFAGADITKAIRPYLLSLTYTDNEEDEADDLQIKLQDRGQLWLEKWIEPMIQAASSTRAGAAASPAGTSYKVTPAIGLNIRSGPGVGYARLGGFACGTVIQVQAIEDGWARLQYSGRTAYVSAAYITPANGGGAAGTDTVGVPDLKLQAVLVQQGWGSQATGRVLDCGQFELDALEVSGPPSVVSIKSTALPFSGTVRQTAKSRAWEGCRLSGIARDIAGQNGMACLYEPGYDPFYSRAEQFQESDISFLSRLCKDAGLSLKATNNILVLFDQAAYEQKPPVRTLRRGGGYISYRLLAGTADARYDSCRVRYTDPATGRCIEGCATVEGYGPDREGNRQLEVTAKVASPGEAKALAGKRLRMHNKYSKTAVFTFPGDPSLVAGVTVLLEGWGAFSGKYIVKQAVHALGSGGYTTKITLRRALEG